jgi:uncharacterized protein (DUF1810 family)
VLTNKQPPSDLARFLNAQENDYGRALAEIRSGRKRSHWMWYIFPQIEGLGHSSTARFYAIKDIEEAKAFLAHTILGHACVNAHKPRYLLRAKRRKKSSAFLMFSNCVRAQHCSRRSSDTSALSGNEVANEVASWLKRHIR